MGGKLELSVSSMSSMSRKGLFLKLGKKKLIFCISRCMNDYVYQIHGALENVDGQFKGLRVLVCNVNYFDIVDVPAEILPKETAKFLQFRLKVTTGALNIQKLPYKVQNDIRDPLGRWLDRWVLENFYGDISNRKGVNP